MSLLARHHHTHTQTQTPPRRQSLTRVVVAKTLAGSPAQRLDKALGSPSKTASPLAAVSASPRALKANESPSLRHRVDKENAVNQRASPANANAKLKLNAKASPRNSPQRRASPARPAPVEENPAQIPALSAPVEDVPLPAAAPAVAVDAWGFASLPLSECAGPAFTPASAASVGAWHVVLRDLPHWIGTRALTRELLRGVPSSLRLVLWESALGSVALASASSQSYASLLAASSTRVPAHVSQQIALDLPRTLHAHALFSQRATQLALSRILHAYALLAPQTGYCQGMSFVCATLMLVAHYDARPRDHSTLHVDEARVFWMFAALLARFDGYWAPDLGGLQRDTRRFGRALAATLPRVSAHLEAEGVSALLFTSKWFLTLLSEGCNAHMDALVRLWDLVVLEGRRGLLRASLAILAANAVTLESLPFEQLLPWLLHVPVHALDPDALAATALAHCRDEAHALDALLDALLDDDERELDAVHVPPTPAFARSNAASTRSLFARAWDVLSPSSKASAPRRAPKRAREESQTADSAEVSAQSLSSVHTTTRVTKRARVEEQTHLAAFASPTRHRSSPSLTRTTEGSPRALRVLSPSSRRSELLTPMRHMFNRLLGSADSDADESAHDAVDLGAVVDEAASVFHSVRKHLF